MQKEIIHSHYRITSQGSTQILADLYHSLKQMQIDFQEMSPEFQTVPLHIYVVFCHIVFFCVCFFFFIVMHDEARVELI